MAILKAVTKKMFASTALVWSQYPFRPLVAQAKMIYGTGGHRLLAKLDRSRQLSTYLGLIINGQSCRL